MPIEASAIHLLVEACLRDRMRARPFAVDPASIRRCLGLEPMPGRTNLRVASLGLSEAVDFQRRLYTYESRPGVSVPCTAYVPSNGGPHPLVIFASDSWLDGRRSPWVQALGISFALRGVCVVAIDPPGVGDRLAMGDRYELVLTSGAPAIGAYVWDLIRGIDFATQEMSVLTGSVAVAGVGFGGSAAILAATIEPKFRCLVVGGAGHSQETSVDDAYRQLSGVADIGDWANVLAHRLDLPVLFLAAEEDLPDRIEATAKKVRASGKRDSKAPVRVDRFLGGRDLNRRMREAAVAFVLHSLSGNADVAYLPEPLPMTDGLTNPAPANTEAADELSVTVSSRTLSDLLADSLAEPHPSEGPSLIPWGKYGRLEPLGQLETVKLVDHGDSPNVIAIPKINAELLVPLGLSIPDLVAQVLHLLLPGGPEGWESLGLQGDALTAMIASVRTLIKGAETQTPPNRIEAEGPLSSLTARLLQAMRPSLVVEATHDFSSWAEVATAGIVVPGARYRNWPLSRTRASAIAEGIGTGPSEYLPEAGSVEELGQVSPAGGSESLSGNDTIGDETDAGQDREWGEKGDQGSNQTGHEPEGKDGGDNDQTEFHAS